MAGLALRKHCRPLQNLYLPASLLAGFIGLLLGPQILGHFTGVSLPIGKTIAQWPGQLTSVVLGLGFVGTKPSKNFGRIVASAVSLLYPLAIPYVVLGPLLSVKLPAWQIWVGSFIIWLGFYITARRNFWHSDRKFSDILSAKSKKPCTR